MVYEKPHLGHCALSIETVPQNLVDFCQASAWICVMVEMQFPVLVDTFGKTDEVDVHIALLLCFYTKNKLF